MSVPCSVIQQMNDSELNQYTVLCVHMNYSVEPVSCFTLCAQGLEIFFKPMFLPVSCKWSWKENISHAIWLWKTFFLQARILAYHHACIYCRYTCSIFLNLLENHVKVMKCCQLGLHMSRFHLVSFYLIVFWRNWSALLSITYSPDLPFCVNFVLRMVYMLRGSKAVLNLKWR